MTLEMKDHAPDRRRAFLVLAGLVAPFVVLLAPESAQCYVRASYAVCLLAIMAGGGAWITFRAHPDDLAKRWTPERFKPGWAVFMRLAGALVIVAAIYLMNSTSRDILELLISGQPKTFVATARSVESKAFLHPIFQTARLADRKQSYATYMFAYGGKRLLPGETYRVSVLPRSRWILSAREENEAASRLP